MTVYPPVAARRELHITRLHSLYYFQFSPNDPLEGESHDFWEMVYMDAGEALIHSGAKRHLLRQGEVFLHEPNRYHRIQLMPDTAPNTFIISFSLKGRGLHELKNRPLTMERSQRMLLARLLEEGSALYGPLLDCHRDLTRDRLGSARFGALQMIVSYLELMLIELVRGCQAQHIPKESTALVTGAGRPEMLVSRLKAYMHEHLSENLTFSDCCRYLGMSATAVKALFRSQNEPGVMHCYQWMRVSEARRVLRSGQWNVTEVAAELGYSSCQAFSAQFRRLMGASPTAYLRRVAAEPELITSKAEHGAKGVS